VERRIDFPLHFDGRGRTAQVEAPAHVRDLIEQVLFTAPGERVNRPAFGSGVHQLVFAPNDDALAGATQVTVQGALQQWLGEQALVEAVDVSSVEAALEITVQYVLRATGERRVERFAREASAP
jgi:phage baseplate assembly protein W